MKTKLNFKHNVINKKIILPCSFEIVKDKLKSKRTEFIFDTGACHTLMHYSELDIMLTENDLTDCEVIMTRGIDSTSKIKFYKIPIQRFIIGDVCIEDTEIYITFDNKCNVNLLGMNILEHVNFIIDNKQKIIVLQHISNGKRCDTIDVYKRQLNAENLIDKIIKN